MFIYRFVIILLSDTNNNWISNGVISFEYDRHISLRVSLCRNSFSQQSIIGLYDFITFQKMIRHFEKSSDCINFLAIYFFAPLWPTVGCFCSFFFFLFLFHLIRKTWSVKTIFCSVYFEPFICFMLKNFSKIQKTMHYLEWSTWHRFTKCLTSITSNTFALKSE